MTVPHRWRIYRRIYMQKFSQHALCQWIVLSFDESSLPITFLGVYVSWREGMSPSILLASLSGSPHSLLCKGMPPRRWNRNIQPTFGYIWDGLKLSAILNTMWPYGLGMVWGWTCINPMKVSQLFRCKNSGVYVALAGSGCSASLGLFLCSAKTLWPNSVPTWTQKNLVGHRWTCLGEGWIKGCFFWSLCLQQCWGAI